MATTKTAKPAAKKTNAKSVAKTLKAPAVKHRVDYKIGTRVKITRRDGSEAKGYTVDDPDRSSPSATCVRETPTGHFIVVNIGDKKNPEIVVMRPAKVRGY